MIGVVANENKFIVDRVSFEDIHSLIKELNLFRRQTGGFDMNYALYLKDDVYDYLNHHKSFSIGVKGNTIHLRKAAFNEDGDIKRFEGFNIFNFSTEKTNFNLRLFKLLSTLK